MGRKLLLLVFLTLPFTFSEAQNRQIKIACVGNSITYGSGISNRDTLSYPAQLQTWLGDDYLVKNFGVSGATMLKKGNKPYWDEKAFQDVKDFLPDIILIKLGTNDSKPMNWQFSEEYKTDYQDMINQFNRLSSRPRIILMTPAPVFAKEKWGINQQIVANEIVPTVKKLAADNRLDLVDLFTALQEAGNFFPDQVHPDPIGCEMMVKEIYIKLFHRTAANRGKGFNSATFAVPSPEYRGAAAGWGEDKDWYSQQRDINTIGKTREVDLVFLGNSITQGWGGEGRHVMSIAPELWDSVYAPRHAANFGISGDRTQHVLWRIRHGNFDHISPSVVVLTIGVNNFSTNTANEIASGIELIVKELKKKLPSAHILLLGPLPAGENPDHPYRILYNEVHKLIKPLGNQPRVEYIKIKSPFILENGLMNYELMARDNIHLQKAGYYTWSELIEPYLSKFFK